MAKPMAALKMLFIATVCLYAVAADMLRIEAQPQPAASNQFEGSRRELWTNRDEVKEAIERRCKTVIWGKEFDHLVQAELIARLGLDIFGGGGSLTIQKLKEMLKDQAQTLGVDLLKKLLLEGKKLTVSQNGRSIYIDGGVASYKHKSWTYKCCFYDWYKFCCCGRCGILWTKAPNTHQPYICIRESSSSNQPSSTKILGKLHIANVGDREFSNSGWMGYTGISSRVEGFTLSLPGMSDHSCRLKYMVHVANRGDTAWVSESAYAGTKGKGLSIEGLRIRLEGSCQGSWGVRYKCHLANLGDTAWARDGAYCGTTGQGRPLEAFQVQMYRK